MKASYPKRGFMFTLSDITMKIQGFVDGAEPF